MENGTRFITYDCILEANHVFYYCIFFSYAVNLPCNNWRFCCTLINLVLDYSSIHFVSELISIARVIRPVKWLTVFENVDERQQKQAILNCT